MHIFPVGGKLRLVAHVVPKHIVESSSSRRLSSPLGSLCGLLVRANGGENIV